MASISIRKGGGLGAREYLAYHKPDDPVVQMIDGKPVPLAVSSTQYSYLYLAKWTAKEGISMVVDQPISAHNVGLRLHCPRFDRDVPEFFVISTQNDEGSSSWVNLITQVERTIIQVIIKIWAVL